MAITLSEGSTDLLFFLVFQPVDQLLRDTSFFEVKKGSGGMDVHPAPEAIRKVIFAVLMKIRFGKFVITMQAESLVVGRKLLATGQAQAGIEDGGQILATLTE